MLVSGSRGAPFTCLRCQLRQAIFHRPRTCIDRAHLDPARSFSARPRQREQQDDVKISIRDDRPYVYHHPLGRIVGAPGRRQRQGTQKLQIDAMKRPFEVIVMQDVREPAEKVAPSRKSHGGALVTSADIQREVAMEGLEPSQDEVNESIDALRPDSTLLDARQYKELAKSLADGFTTEQLHGFLSYSLKLSKVKADTVHLLRQRPTELQTRYRRTQWRPGRSRLEKRLPMGDVVKKSEKTNRPKLVEQILRLVWNLSVHAEEQKSGELEIKLKSWEMKYLFDVEVSEEHSKVPMYHKFVKSPILLRTCDIRPYRPHNVVRISGRRKDAEEMAEKLEQNLPEVEKTPVDLRGFSSLLGTPGWPRSLEKLFRPEDIRYIQQRTFTIIEQPQPGMMNIYGGWQALRFEARRLLIALLELSDPESIVTLLPPRTIPRVLPLPEAPGVAVHFRHRDRRLTRLSAPTAKTATKLNNAAKDASVHLATQATAVQKALSQFPPLTTPSSARESSLWKLDVFMTSPWNAQICRVLHSAQESSGGQRSKKAGPKGTPNSNFTLVCSQVHHLETLLSYFVLRRNQTAGILARTHPSLVARFMPSPFGGAGTQGVYRLPVVELLYHLFTNEKGKTDLYLHKAGARWATEDLRVPLPSEATDLRFTRQTITRTIDQRKDLKDAEIVDFTQTLRKSLHASQSGKLEAKPKIKIRLPASYVDPQAQDVEGSLKEVDYPYLFAGFEQRQTREFSAVEQELLPASLDPEVKETLWLFREGMYLHLQEVYGGVFGGRRTEVSLRRGVRSAQQFRESAQGEGGAELNAGDEHPFDTPHDDGPARTDGNHSLQVRSALKMARLLTKIAKGEVKALRRNEQHQAIEQEHNEDDGVDVSKPDQEPPTQDAVGKGE